MLPVGPTCSVGDMVILLVYWLYLLDLSLLSLSFRFERDSHFYVKNCHFFNHLQFVYLKKVYFVGLNCNTTGLGAPILYIIIMIQQF